MERLQEQSNQDWEGQDSGQSKDKFQLGILVFFFAGLFILALGTGLFFFKNNKAADSDLKILSASTASASPVGEIVVDIAGAVVQPGVYKLPQYSRVSDAVFVAGGFRDEADRAKINQAAKLVDGQKINVPTLSEQVISEKGQVISQDNLISINNAGEAELDKLPGVGPVTAQKIISLRPYSSLDDLINKKAVSRSTFEKIKDRISL